MKQNTAATTQPVLASGKITAKIVWNLPQPRLCAASTNRRSTPLSANVCRITASGKYSLGYPRKDKGQEVDALVSVSRWPIREMRHALLMDDWPVDGAVSTELHLWGGYDRPDGFGTLRFDDGVGWKESFEYATATLRFENCRIPKENLLGRAEIKRQDPTKSAEATRE